SLLLLAEGQPGRPPPRLALLHAGAPEHLRLVPVSGRGALGLFDEGGRLIARPVDAYMAWLLAMEDGPWRVLDCYPLDAVSQGGDPLQDLAAAARRRFLSGF
ncbi:MAG: hypothetical protein ACOCXJ_04025, partial [Planctomycetota bacterium]